MSQYGLVIDNVLAFELVKSDGMAVDVTAGSLDVEFFFGLKVPCKSLFCSWEVVEGFTLRVV